MFLLENRQCQSTKQRAIYELLLKHLLVTREETQNSGQWESKDVSKISLLHDIHLLQFKNLKSLVQMSTLNAGISNIIPKRNSLKFLTWHLPFNLSIRRYTQIEFGSSCVLWRLLLLMKPWVALQNGLI